MLAVVAVVIGVVVVTTCYCILIVSIEDVTAYMFTLVCVDI